MNGLKHQILFVMIIRILLEEDEGVMSILIQVTSTKEELVVENDWTIY